MLRRHFLSCVGACAAGLSLIPGAALAGRPLKSEGEAPMSPPQGHTAYVNGVELYYEVHGQGAPLILLHGGLATINEIFGALLPVLAAHQQVIAVELQGHGHTADPGRPMTYEAMADDIGGLIDHLGLGQVDVAGYSVGGGVALQTAFRHPSKVRKLVVISAPFATEGWYAEVVEGTGAMNADQMVGSRWHEAYLRAAPKPDDWGLLVRNVGALMTSTYDWSPQVSAMNAPVLTIVGDADSVRIEHAADLFKRRNGGLRDGFGGGRPASQLCIVPGAHHLDILDRVEILGPTIAHYLRSGVEDVPPAY